MLPYIAWFALLAGPRCPSNVTAQELLAEHLEWERRTGAASGGDEEPWEEEPSPVGGPAPGAGAEAALEPDDVRDLVTAAALELSRAWQEDVLAGVPSRFMLDLCGVADRAAYLLEEAAPDLARWGRRLRAVFMAHSQGGDRRTPEELGRALAELEALLDAVVRRAYALHGSPP